MRSHLIKAALPFWISQSGTNTSWRVTQKNEIFNGGGKFTCAYYGKNVFLFVFKSLSFGPLPQRALCSFLFCLHLSPAARLISSHVILK